MIFRRVSLLSCIFRQVSKTIRLKVDDFGFTRSFQLSASLVNEKNYVDGTYHRDFAAIPYVKLSEIYNNLRATKFESKSPNIKPWIFICIYTYENRF